MSQPRFCDEVLPHISNIQTYQPGKPISELQREHNLLRISKLASNENPLGASPKAIKAVQTELSNIGRYPDGNSFYLKQALADFLQKKPSEIALGNGSNELLELVARIFAGKEDEIIYSQYAFSVYSISAQAVGATGVEVPAKDWGHDLQAMADAITDKTKLIYLANPNNPTGTLFTQPEWEAFIARVPSNVIVVLDEAYTEYVAHEEYANGLEYLEQYPNLIVSRTFSKAYGLAALRIGYMIANEELIAYINRLRAPFNINHLAQVAAIAALKDPMFVKKTVDLNRQGMQTLTEFFEEKKLSYIPSQGNFICLNLGQDALHINQALLKEGVIVRPVATEGEFSQFLRVSIGLPSENQHFMAALNKILTASIPK